MKKIYLLFLGVTLISASALAQTESRVITTKEKTLLKTLDYDHGNGLMLKGATTDTAGWNESGNFDPIFLSGGGAPSIYSYTGGGWAYGSNNDSINIVGQGFINNGGPHSDGSTVEIKEVLVWFFAKDNVGGGSLNVNILDMGEDNAITDITAFNANPGVDGIGYGPNYTPLGSESLTIANADTSSGGLVFTSIPFTTPVSVTGDFVVQIDASPFIASGDTIGIVAGTDGEGFGMLFLTWTTQSWWVSDQAMYDSDVNLAIFAVIGDNNVGIDSDEYYNGVQLSAYPVPATTNTTIAFNLNRDFNNVIVKVVDSNGKVVHRNAMGTLSQGEYKEVVDVTALAAGNYYYTLYAEGTKLTKKFVVVK